MKYSTAVTRRMTEMRQACTPTTLPPALPADAPIGLILELITRIMAWRQSCLYGFADSVYVDFFSMLRVLRTTPNEAKTDRCKISKRSAFYQEILKPMNLPPDHEFWTYFTYV